MVCVLSPCLSLTEQQRHLLQQQEQQLQQLQQLLASPQLTPVMPSLPRQLPHCRVKVGVHRVRADPGWHRRDWEGRWKEEGSPRLGPCGACRDKKDKGRLPALGIAEGML